jgi:hypothetical protein
LEIDQAKVAAAFRRDAKGVLHAEDGVARCTANSEISFAAVICVARVPQRRPNF